MAGIDDDEDSGVSAQRLDKWLWFARVVRTRTLAAALVEEGKVRVNGVKATKPAHTVKVGDHVVCVLRERVRVLEVIGFGSRRGGAATVAALYKDHAPAPPRGSDGSPHTDPAQPAADAQRGKGAGRPTKRDRRQIERFKSRST